MDEAQLAMLEARMRRHEENRLAAFRLFIFVYLLTIGGCIYLSVGMNLTPAAKLAYSALTDTAVFVLAAVCSLMVAANLQTWRLYRRSEGERPRLTEPSALIEIAMIAGMALAFLAFAVFNPFLVLAIAR